jgi:excinuclease ABC subunit A
MEQTLAYYTSQSAITDPGPHASLFDDLPVDIAELFAVIQGLLLHRNSSKYYGVQRTTQQNTELGLRTMQQRLGRILELDPAPLTVPRDPSERQIALCRDFAVFLTSILRHKGIPARMRVGFAAYFPDSPWYGDHWITEYWNGDLGRWVLADADIGGMPRDAFKEPLKCNPEDLLYDHDFYVAGSAWKLAREGKIKSTFFRYSERWKGFPCIRGNLLHDFQSLNKLETRIFDYFDDLHRKPEHEMNVEDKALLDRIAELTYAPDVNFDEMRALFDELPRTALILAKLGLSEAARTGQPVDPNALKPSGAEQLATLGGQYAPAKPHHFRTTEADALGDGGELPFTPEVGAYPAPPGMDDIVVRGARQHNLKNITVRIPRNKLVVFTGVSGSGKSSLAFDTLYAEGQRRYVESLSSFARQFMEQMEKPQVDQITGLNPAIAIEQKTITRNPRSTVGTVTEVLDYLRVLYARLGTPHCPLCGQAVQPQGAQQIANHSPQCPQGCPGPGLFPRPHRWQGTRHRRVHQSW